MNGWAIFGMICAAVIVIVGVPLVLMNVKDLYRYIKISNM
jgi:hypothetical protein